MFPHENWLLGMNPKYMLSLTYTLYKPFKNNPTGGNLSLIQMNLLGGKLNKVRPTEYGFWLNILHITLKHCFSPEHILANPHP